MGTGGLTGTALAAPASQTIAQAASTTDSAGTAAATTLLSATTQVGRAQHFRADFGFRTDVEYVSSVIAGRSLNQEITQKYGYFLTPEEQNSMDYRMAQNSAIQAPAFQRYIHSAADYGGMWVDQKAGGVVHVLFTGNLSQHQADLRGFFAYPDALRIESAQHSDADLRALLDRIAADRPKWAALGLQVGAVRQDVIAGTVVVGVDKLSSPIATQLLATYGDAVRVEQGSMPEDTGAYGPCFISGAGPKCGYVDAPPFAGGQEVDRYDTSSGVVLYMCTSAFPVYRNNGLFNFTYWVMTARHCGASGSAWEQVAVHMGTVDQRSCCWDDMTITTTGGGNVVAPRVLRTVTFDKGWDGIYDIIHRQQAQDADYVGEAMCQAGIHLTYVCGTEVNHNENVCFADFDGTHCYNFLREASFDSEPGDSGGPVYDSGGTAIGSTDGVVTYSDGTRHEIFTHIFDSTNSLGVSVLTG